MQNKGSVCGESEDGGLNFMTDYTKSFATL